MIFNNEKRDYLTVLVGKETMTNISLNTTALRTGARIRNSQIEPFSFNLPISIVKPKDMTWGELEEDMASWLIQDKDKKLILSSNPNRFYLARVTSIDISKRTRNTAEGDITVYCAIPFKHSLEKSISVTSNAKTYNILGHVNTHWTATVEFTSNTNTYTIENNGKKITLNYQFISGDVLKIDSFTRSITLNGNNILVALSLESDWFMLNKGDNQIKSNINTQIKYNERYY